MEDRFLKIRISAELFNRLRQYCSEHDTTISEFIRKMIKENI